MHSLVSVLLRSALSVIVLPLGCGAAEPPHLRVPQAVVRPALTAAADDSAWSAAVVIPALGLSLKERTAVPVLQPTTVRLLWDAEAL